jgi:glucose dehydrogenase
MKLQTQREGGVESNDLPLTVTSISRQGTVKECVRLVPTVFASAIVVVVSLTLQAFSTSAGDLGRALPSDVAPARARITEWPQASFDPEHTGYNRFERVLSPSNVGRLTQAWASQVGDGILYTTPIVFDLRVYIGSSGGGRIYCFDAQTGATIWVGQ